MNSQLLQSMILFLLLLSSVSFDANAQIYKWVDSKGKSHFTDKPPKNTKVESVTLKNNSYSGSTVTIVGGVKVFGGRLVIYTTARCGFCKKAKRYFRKNRILYNEYDIEKTSKGKRDYKTLNGHSVPIILLGNKRIQGFAESTFKRHYATYLKKKEEKEKTSL